MAGIILGIDVTVSNGIVQESNSSSYSFSGASNSLPFSITITPNAGYTLPSLIISNDNNNNDSYSWDSLTGILTFIGTPGNGRDSMQFSIICEEEVIPLISSFNTLSIIEYTNYITLQVGENSINIAKGNWEYPKKNNEILKIEQVYQATQNNSQLNIE